MHKLTGDRRKWGATALLAGAVLGGIGPLGGPPAAGAAPRRSPSTWRINGDEVGPIRLGMSETSIRRIAKQYGLRMLRVRGPSIEVWGINGEGPAHGKRPTWKLLVSRGAKPLLVIHYDETDRMHSPIEVVDPRLTTLEGAHIGTPFRTLARLYRRGGVTQEGTRIFVDFEDPRVMFTDFYLAGGRRTRLSEEPVNRPVRLQATNKAQEEKAEAAWQKRAWQQLLRDNPKISSIVLSGD